MPKQLLQTIRKNGNWVAYASKKARDPNKVLAIPQEENSLLDKTVFENYLKRHFDSLTQILTGVSNSEHESGYYRSLIAPFLTTLAGSTITTGGLLSIAAGKHGNEDVGDWFSVSLSGLGILTMLTGATLSVFAFRAADRNKWQREQYTNALEFQERLPDIKNEIELKDKVLANLIKLIHKIDKDRLVNNILHNDESDSNLRERLALLIDKQDDLKVYEGISKLLLTINKARYFNQEKPLIQTIVKLIKQHLDVFMENNTSLVLSKDIKDKNITIQDLLTLTVTGFTEGAVEATELAESINVKDQELMDILSKTLTDTLKDIDKVKAITMLDELIKTSSINEAVISAEGMDVMLLLEKLLKPDVNFEVLVNNLKILLSEDKKSTNEHQILEEILVNYLNETNKIKSDAETIADLFKDICSNKEDIESNVAAQSNKIKPLLKQLMHILEDDSLVDQLSNNPSITKLSIWVKRII